MKRLLVSGVLVPLIGTIFFMSSAPSWVRGTNGEDVAPPKEVASKKSAPPKLKLPTPAPGTEKAAVLLLAENATKRIESEESHLQEISERLTKSIDAFSPGALSLAGEHQTLEAFRDYLDAHRAEGPPLIRDLEALRSSDTRLAHLFRTAPTYYREAARFHLERAANAKYESNSELYREIGAVFLGIAQNVEARAKAFKPSGTPAATGEKNASTDEVAGLINYLKEYVELLDNFRQSVDGAFGTALPKKADRDVMKKLASFKARSDQLRDQLKRFRSMLDVAPARN